MCVCVCARARARAHAHAHAHAHARTHTHAHARTDGHLIHPPILSIPSVHISQQCVMKDTELEKLQSFLQFVYPSAHPIHPTSVHIATDAQLCVCVCVSDKSVSVCTHAHHVHPPIRPYRNRFLFRKTPPPTPHPPYSRVGREGGMEGERGGDGLGKWMDGWMDGWMEGGSEGARERGRTESVDRLASGQLR